MKCREFQGDLAEYVGGRLPPSLRAEMRAHAEACEACAHEETGERALRARFAHPPAIPACPDLWSQIASQWHASLPRRLIASRVRTFGSASAVCVVLAGLLWMVVGAPRFTPSVLPVRPDQQDAEETGMLQMVADLRQKPLEESDTLLQNIQSDQQERSVLLGSRGKE
jgi:anti-sigma factor RsiW